LPIAPTLRSRMFAETGVIANNRPVGAADPSPKKGVGDSHLPPTPLLWRGTIADGGVYPAE